jgi:hypothetical protein
MPIPQRQLHRFKQSRQVASKLPGAINYIEKSGAAKAAPDFPNTSKKCQVPPDREAMAA